MKRFLLILCALTLVLTMTACKGKDKKNTDSGKETTAVETNKDGTPKETKETTPEGDVVEPTPGSNDESGIQGAVIYTDETDEEGNYIAQETMPEMVTISEGGTEKGLWPDEVPDEVPVFDGYTEMFAATYERYPNSDFWSLTFDTTEADYIAWLTEVQNAGFLKSDKVYGFYGKGDIIIDIWPEDAGDIYYLSIDVYKTDAPAIPDIFPKFETDCALFDWTDEGGVLTVSYECGTDFAADSYRYINTLKEKGFTFNGTIGSLTSGGKTYIAAISDNDKTIEYTY